MFTATVGPARCADNGLPRVMSRRIRVLGSDMFTRTRSMHPGSMGKKNTKKTFGMRPLLVWGILWAGVASCHRAFPFRFGASIEGNATNDDGGTSRAHHSLTPIMRAMLCSAVDISDYIRNQSAAAGKAATRVWGIGNDVISAPAAQHLVRSCKCGSKRCQRGRICCSDAFPCAIRECVRACEQA